MTLFIRLNDIPANEKARELHEAAIYGGDRVYQKPAHSFQNIPGHSFVYWVSDHVINIYKNFPPFENEGRTAKCGLGTLDDFRFLRLWWELLLEHNLSWVPFAKGGSFSPWHSDIPMRVFWKSGGKELKCFVETKVGSASRKIQAQSYYFKPGLTFPRRPHKMGWFSVRGLSL